MSAIGKDSFSGGFLVYINGVRVPASSANVAVSLDSPAQANIALPAHYILEGLGEEDLLDVAIFYLDNYYYEKATWCLLFEGRITGQGYENTPSSESLYFTCESYSNALNDLYLNFMPKGKGTTTSNKSYPNQIDVRGKSYKKFLSESLSGRALARPFDLIDNIYSSVFGSSTAKLESRLDNLATKSVKDLVAKRKLAIELKAEKGAKRILGNPQGYTSGAVYRDMLATIKEELVQEHIENNLGEYNPSTVDSDLETSIREEIKASIYKGSSTVTTGFFSRYFRKIRSRNHWVCSPYFEGRPNTNNPIKEYIGGGVFPLFRASKTKRYAKSIAKNSGAKFGPGGSAYGVVKNIFNLYSYRVSEILAPPAYTVDKYGLPKDKFEASREDEDYMSWSSRLTKSEDRLAIASFLTHPISSFSIPPMCNTIFPSTRISFSINNSYSNKPTRLYYDKKSPYGRLDFSVNSSSYATDSSRVTFPSVVAGAAQKAAGKASEQIDLLVFPEEYYRGPRPMPGQMHPTYMDLSKYASASRFGTVDRGDPAVPINSIEGMDPEEAISALESVEKSYKKKISSYGVFYLLARKEFLKMKYNATGTLNTLFNPYLVCGFPCSILSGGKSGLHYYGEIVSVNHTLTPNSNSTSVQVGTIRTVNSVIKGIVADKFDVDSYPQEPVQEIRDMLQVFEAANEYYTQIFKKEEIGSKVAPDFGLQIKSLEIRGYIEEYEDIIRNLRTKVRIGMGKDSYSGQEGGSTNEEMLEQCIEAQQEHRRELAELTESDPNLSPKTYGFPAAFDFKSFLGWERKENPDVVDYIIINELDKTRRQAQPGSRMYIDQRSKKIGYQRSKLVPLKEVSKYFKSSTQAMKLVSRPVCTLEQYIDFYSCVDLDLAISSVEGRGRGCRLGERNSHFSGAKFYDVIRQYIGGPGIEPGTSVAKRSKNLLDRLAKLQAEREQVAQSSVEASEIDVEHFEHIREKIQEAENTEDLILSGIGPRGFKTFTRLSANQEMKLQDLPDSRRDWQRLLLDYLTIIEGTKPSLGDG